MSLKLAFAAMLHLFVVFAFFLASLFFLALPFFPEWQTALQILVLHHLDASTQVGLGLLAVSLALLAGFYALHRGSYLRVRMGGKSQAEIDLRLLRQTLDQYFKSHFAKEARFREAAIVSGSKLDIELTLIPQDVDEREKILERLEAPLAEFLRSRFGYAKPFHLILKQ